MANRGQFKAPESHSLSVHERSRFHRFTVLCFRLGIASRGHPWILYAQDTHRSFFEYSLSL